ncbi:MAG: hypothetical protein ACI92W_002954 [Paraglaciecola sp.]|jgi:hypothetical protein
MKKIKLIFYPIYVLTIAAVLLLSADIYASLDVMQQWGWYKYFSDLPLLGRNLLLFLCSMMVLELVIQYASAVRMRNTNRS